MKNQSRRQFPGMEVSSKWVEFQFWVNYCVAKQRDRVWLQSFPSNSDFSYFTGSTLSSPPLCLLAHRSPWSCLLVGEEGHSTIWAQTSWFSAPLCFPAALSLQQQRRQKYVSYFKKEQLDASQLRSQPSCVQSSHGTLITLFSFCSVVCQTSFGCSQCHQPFLPLRCVDGPEVKILFPWYCEVNPCRIWGMNWGNTQRRKHTLLLTMHKRQWIIRDFWAVITKNSHSARTNLGSHTLRFWCCLCSLSTRLLESRSKTKFLHPARTIEAASLESTQLEVRKINNHPRGEKKNAISDYDAQNETMNDLTTYSYLNHEYTLEQQYVHRDQLNQIRMTDWLASATLASSYLATIFNTKLWSLTIEQRQEIMFFIYLYKQETNSHSRSMIIAGSSTSLADNLITTTRKTSDAVMLTATASTGPIKKSSEWQLNLQLTTYIIGPLIQHALHFSIAFFRHSLLVYYGEIRRTADCCGGSMIRHALRLICGVASSSSHLGYAQNKA